MRRVLIVSPRFPPVNAADMHRVRQSLPYLAENGWEPTILTVDPAQSDTALDPWLLRTVPKQTRIVQVGALSASTVRRLGLGSLDLRAFPHLARAGARLLKAEPFDLVYISTTAFATMGLGPLWHRQFGVPYVIDLQDPWVSDYYSRPGSPPPPGGRFKFGLSQSLARVLEPVVFRHAAHTISVSAQYPVELCARYPWLTPELFTTLPFGAPESDYDEIIQHPVTQPIFDPEDGLIHWVYVGASGPIMALSLTAIFTALATARSQHPDTYGRIRLHFVGTSYANDHRAVQTVRPIAEACGVGDVVTERPRRIPYAEALQCMLDADALLLPGSDDPAYTASKLYPVMLARKPLLAVFHEKSSVIDIIDHTRSGVAVGFKKGEPSAQIAKRILSEWFDSGQWRRASHTDWEQFEPYTAREMTRQQCLTFDAVVRGADG